MAYTLVTGQIAQAEATALTVTAVLPNAPTTGNLVVALVVQGFSTQRTFSVADLAGTPNNYTATSKTTFLANSQNVGIFYFIATATANKSIKATSNGSALMDIFVAEFSGNASSSVFENDATGSQTSVTTVNLPSYTTLNNGDLLVGCVCTAAAVTTANSPWTGWTGGVPGSGNYAEYFIQSTPARRLSHFLSRAEILRP